MDETNEKTGLSKRYANVEYYIILHNKVISTDFSRDELKILMYLSKCRQDIVSRFIRTNEIHIKTGIDQHNIRVCLKRLIDKGLVDNVAKGYRAIARGDEYTTCPCTLLRSDIYPTSIRVYLYLSKAQGVKEDAYPSNTTIQDACKINIRSVYRSIRELEEWGWIKKTHKGWVCCNRHYLRRRVKKEKRKVNNDIVQLEQKDEVKIIEEKNPIEEKKLSREERFLEAQRKIL